MTRAERLGFVALLIAMGAGWGITQPLTKIAVSGGYEPFGLIFWQTVISAVLIGAINLMRGKAFAISRGALAVYVFIAFVGTILPNTASYRAAVHLPSGVLSILLSLVPIFAFPVALVMGLDRFRAVRLFGLLFGLVGVALLVLPDTSLPDRSMIPWVFVGLISGLCYAFEGNGVAKFGLAGMDALQAIWGASVVAALISLPLALQTGQFIDPRAPWGPPDMALVASSVIHAVVYTGYVWLVGRAGPVFAVQVSYLVTGFGVLWAKLLLAETYSPYIWAALALIFAGLFLVQPRRASALAAPVSISETGR